MKGEVGTYYKLALPNLEVGDIIDYYYISKKAFPKEANTDVFADFDPEFIVLQEYTPIRYGVLNLRPGRLAYLNYKPLNGLDAPEVLH